MDDDEPGRGQLLDKLKAQALTAVESGRYFGREVPLQQLLWHYGQVGAVFPDNATLQLAELVKFSSLLPLEKSERVYALARVLQGAYAAKEKKTVDAALVDLYACQSIDRPLGYGIVGETVKGSLNVLDALWPNLPASDKLSIGTMIDALFYQYRKANTIGFVVAVDAEREALEEELENVGASLRKDGAVTIVEHANFYAIICQGKSLTAATEATLTVVEDHAAKWVLMPGIAGSLGKPSQDPAQSGKFIGPDQGDVVIAASLAPYGVRDKVRRTVENAKVPFEESTWLSIPTDPQLFRLAHAAAEALSSEFKSFHEGLIVSGRGIKDDADEKERILAEFPGGLAVEEEGYAMGIVCLSRRVPYLNIRAVSDRAHGDKLAQKSDPAVKIFEQKKASKIAVKLAVNIAQRLGGRL